MIIHLVLWLIWLQALVCSGGWKLIYIRMMVYDSQQYLLWLTTILHLYIPKSIVWIEEGNITFHSSHKCIVLSATMSFQQKNSNRSSFWVLVYNLTYFTFWLELQFVGYSTWLFGICLRSIALPPSCDSQQNLQKTR